ncbi:hypothetical protein [Pseudophaeobacter sp.]|uniref:head-tail joining protein n=1 Tax=Pseudophaeobacter sp. TaxID=1971739 RepID=UPI0032637AB8
MSPFSRAVDAGFARLGLDAVLEQGALSRDVKILPAEADEFAEFQSTPLKQQGGSYEIRQTEFAGFSNGAVLVLTAERRKVQSFECRDKLRLKYVLMTVPA